MPPIAQAKYPMDQIPILTKVAKNTMRPITISMNINDMDRISGVLGNPAFSGT
jgi:hypothetical protein